MKRTGFLTLIIAVLLTFSMSGCGTSDKVHKSGAASADLHTETLKKLSKVENASELTARFSLNVSGRKASGQLRMRRDRSVQIGISLLGLVEVVRIEFLPEKVVIMDRTTNRYTVCHYADLPLRNELGLDFNVVQALFWNRLFSPGVADETELLSNIVYNGTDELNGSSVFKERVYDYLFKVNPDRNLTLTSKTVSGSGLSVGYSDFRAVTEGFVFPMTLNLEMAGGANPLFATLTLSSVSTAKGNWPDETGVGRRMTKVTLDELTEGLSL